MKKVIFFGISIAFLFASCKKTDQHNPYNNCDVSAYHLPFYDAFNPDYPFLFAKIYDASGNLKEIVCTFFNAASPATIRQYDLLIKYNNAKLYFLNKNNISDTILKVTMDAKGRPIHAEGESILTFPGNSSLINQFVYKNNRLFSVRVDKYDPLYPVSTVIDTCFYDNKGNIIKFDQNTYQYDYSRKAKEQFYIDDYMAFNNGFYLLEYLGFYPELTSPVNVRTRIDNPVNHSNLTNHQFDADGKLIQYHYSGSMNGDAVIGWNCDNDKTSSGL